MPEVKVRRVPTVGLRVVGLIQAVRPAQLLEKLNGPPVRAPRTISKVSCWFTAGRGVPS